MRRLVALVVAFVCVGMSAPSWAAVTQWSIDAASSAVVWTAVGNPGFLEIKGEGAKPSGDVVLAPDGSYLGVVTVDLKPTATGIKLRDEHMHGKYLETIKFPTASLKLDEGFKGQGKWCGALTIKGVAKPVCGAGQVSGSDGAKTAELTFKIAVKDYPSIGVPSYMGVTMAETVDVKVSLVAKPKV